MNKICTTLPLKRTKTHPLDTPSDTLLLTFVICYGTIISGGEDIMINGTIRKEKDIFIGQIAIGKYDNGRIKYKRFKGKKKADVIKKMEEFQFIMQQGTAEVADSYLDDCLMTWARSVKKIELKPSSYNSLICIIQQSINPALGHYALNALTPQLIQTELINKMFENGKSLSTIKKAYVYLKAGLKYCLPKGTFNPCDDVVLPSKDKFEKKEIRFFNDEEVLRFKAYAPKYKYGKILILGMYTGLRGGELCGLKWKQIDWEKKRIFVDSNAVTMYQYDDHNGEGKYIVIEQDSAKSKDRYVDLNKTALCMLDELKAANYKGEESFVATKEKKPLSIHNLASNYVSICKKAKIENCQGVHTLRHTFASMLFRKGVDAKTVSELLGHASVAFTLNTYVHLIEDQKREAVNLIDDL